MEERIFGCPGKEGNEPKQLLIIIKSSSPHVMPLHKKEKAPVDEPAAAPTPSVEALTPAASMKQKAPAGERALPLTEDANETLVSEFDLPPGGDIQAAVEAQHREAVKLIIAARFQAQGSASGGDGESSAKVEASKKLKKKKPKKPPGKAPSWSRGPFQLILAFALLLLGVAVVIQTHEVSTSAFKAKTSAYRKARQNDAKAAYEAKQAAFDAKEAALRAARLAPFADILNVPTDATTAAIKAAFRR